MCGSGMQAAIMAADTIAAGSADIVVAGGMESMTNAPYLLPKHRGGARIGHDRIIDHMFFDGLEDAYEQGRLMGSFAEESAREYQFTREAQDDYAIASPRPAPRRRRRNGAFDREIVAVEIPGRKGPTTVDDGRAARPRATPAKIPSAQARLRQGRHDHRRQRLVDLRRRRRAGDDPRRASPTGSASSRSPASSATPPTPTSPRKFTTAPVGAMTEGAGEGRLDASTTSISSRSTRPSPASR